MKIILKDEVDNLGLAGDVVDVADGYGRNYLIPRGLAILATPGAMKEAEALTRSRKVAESKTLDGAKEKAADLESRVLRIPSRVDDAGHLYGSVNVNDVQRVLKERGYDIEKRRIDLKGNIKTVGSYEVPVQVHPQVVATVTVEVTDAEGKVGLDGKLFVDEEAVADVAADAAEGSETDADVLAEQALEAAKEYEAQQAAENAGDDAPELGDRVEAAAEGDDA